MSARLPAAGGKRDRASGTLARPSAGSGEAAFAARTNPQCPTCNGLRIVFSCPRWPGCHCPGGTTLPECPGVSAPCPDCTAEALEAEATQLMAAGDIFSHPIGGEHGRK